MKSSVHLILLLVIFLSACKPTKQQADFIVINAKIYTVNPDFELVDGFAVKDNKFVAVGNSKEIQETFNAKETIDMKGKVIYPGFYDAHCHFYGYGLNLQKANLKGTKSFDEVIARVKQFADENPSEWIFGRGWDQNDWEIPEFPTNEKLNKAFPNTPVVLTRIDGHAAIVNDAALKYAKITPKSKIEGGKLIIKNGKLSGVLIDNAMELVNSAIPVHDSKTKARALLKAQDKCFEVGLTTVDDAGLDYSTIMLIDSLQKMDSLKMRIYAMLQLSNENIEKFLKKGPQTTDKLNVRCIKLYADGALGSRGACLLKDYSDDPGNKGLIVTEAGLLKEICRKAYDYNYQVATHAIGDSANRIMLNIYGEILKKANDRRWRIEHAQVIDKEDFMLFKAYSIIPSVQPTHATSDMYWAGDRLGTERIKFAYAYKELLNTNGWLPAGSDFPIEDINPLFGFYASVARMDQEYYPGGAFQKENALSREEALKSMTIWAARSNFEEDYKGSIEAGKLADFVVLDKDIMLIDIKEVFKVKVLQTFIGGKRVYSEKK